MCVCADANVVVELVSRETMKHLRKVVSCGVDQENYHLVFNVNLINSTAER